MPITATSTSLVSVTSGMLGPYLCHSATLCTRTGWGKTWRRWSQWPQFHFWASSHFSDASPRLECRGPRSCRCLPPSVSPPVCPSLSLSLRLQDVDTGVGAGIRRRQTVKRKKKKKKKEPLRLAGLRARSSALREEGCGLLPSESVRLLSSLFGAGSSCTGPCAIKSRVNGFSWRDDLHGRLMCNKPAADITHCNYRSQPLPTS